MPRLNMSQLKYFYDVEDGYFLDIGGFNPITISLSRPLLSMGWNGITVEPNPKRARSFFEQRLDQTVLNVAGG